MGTTDEDLIARIKGAQQRTVLLTEDLAAIDSLARKLIAGQPQEPDPNPPTDEALAAQVRTAFLARTVPRGYDESNGWPRDTIGEWVALLRETIGKGGSIADLYPQIDMDVDEWWPLKTGGGTTPTNPKEPDAPVVIPPSGQDERPSIALIRDRMDRSKGHEVVPSIMRSMQTWGIGQHIVMTPETNPGPQWASTPPDRSNRRKARGWLCVAGDNARRNTADNAATRIYLARTFLWLKDGRMLGSVPRMYDSGMIPDAGLSWNGAVPAVLLDRAANDSAATVRYVNDLRPQSRDSNGNLVSTYDRRTWHPTLQDVEPGGELRNSVIATLVAVQFGAVPIDPSKPFDPEKLNNCLYVGLDNYDPQQDGISGRFIKIQPYKRWDFAWWGDEGALRRLPPDLPGWQA